MVEALVELMLQIWPYLLAAAVGAVLFHFLSRQLRKYVIGKRLRHGRNAEEKAFRIIEAHGFKVVNYQPARDYFMHIDHKKEEVRLKPDFIIEKSGKRYICEVKTGDMATDPSQTSTRRQLLEYFVMIPCDGMYLLDADREQLIRVAFKTVNRVGMPHFWRNLSLFLIAGILSIWIYRLLFP
jgi:hypothetical protein